MKKQWVKVITSIILLLALSACAATETKIDHDSKQEVNGSKGSNGDKQPTGMVEGELKAELETRNEDRGLQITFVIKNNKEKEDVLKYSSSQIYDYSIIDSTNNSVYTYSMDKLFSQMTSEQILKPGESKRIDLELSKEVLNSLKPGTYHLEVWSTAIDRKELRAKTEFHWGGEGEGLEEAVIQEAEVIFVGLMDPHSIEVVNSEGQYDHYQLSENVKQQMSTLEKDTKIVILFSIIEGQKVIQEIAVK